MTCGGGGDRGDKKEKGDDGMSFTHTLECTYETILYYPAVYVSKGLCGST